jgi:hypothetical protein
MCLNKPIAVSVGMHLSDDFKNVELESWEQHLEFKQTAQHNQDKIFL